jgi:hypothetical protein
LSLDIKFEKIDDNTFYGLVNLLKYYCENIKELVENIIFNIDVKKGLLYVVFHKRYLFVVRKGDTAIGNEISPQTGYAVRIISVTILCHESCPFVQKNYKKQTDSIYTQISTYHTDHFLGKVQIISQQKNSINEKKKILKPRLQNETNKCVYVLIGHVTAKKAHLCVSEPSPPDDNFYYYFILKFLRIFHSFTPEYPMKQNQPSSFHQ